MDPRIRLGLIAIAVIVGIIAANNKNRRHKTDTQRWEREHNISDPGNDPRFKAAEAEARRRWPEFVAAFNRREPNVAYAVKARFTDGSATEWMWVQVQSIAGDM